MLSAGLARQVHCRDGLRLARVLCVARLPIVLLSRSILLAKCGCLVVFLNCTLTLSVFHCIITTTLRTFFLSLWYVLSYACSQFDLTHAPVAGVGAMSSPTGKLSFGPDWYTRPHFPPLSHGNHLYKSIITTFYTSVKNYFVSSLSRIHFCPSRVRATLVNQTRPQEQQPICLNPLCTSLNLVRQFILVISSATSRCAGCSRISTVRRVLARRRHLGYARLGESHPCSPRTFVSTHSLACTLSLSHTHMRTHTLTHTFMNAQACLPPFPSLWTSAHMLASPHVACHTCAQAYKHSHLPVTRVLMWSSLSSRMHTSVCSPLRNPRCPRHHLPERVLHEQRVEEVVVVATVMGVLHDGCTQHSRSWLGLSRGRLSLSPSCSFRRSSVQTLCSLGRSPL